MAEWQTTHGRARGAYLSIEGNELYVRQVLDQAGAPIGRWRLFVNGELEGEADGEITARTAAELAVRCMAGAEASGMATAARHLRSTT